MTKKDLDGGYYATKGFNFQFDFTIQNILNQTDDKQLIEIEQTEDLSDKNCIIQVKYKEKSNYSSSNVKKPICQLLNIFKNDKRSPILYAHFKNKSESEKQLTLDELNDIIGNCKVDNTIYTFDDKLKNAFREKFRIKFTNKYQQQFDDLILKICQEFKCDEDEAQIHYCSMYKYIERKVLDNPPTEKHLRSCSKSELKSLIEHNNELVFYKQYSNFKGKEKYYKLIKKKYFTNYNLSMYERVFILTFKDYHLSDLKEFLYKLKENFYKATTVRGVLTIKSPAPYVLLNGISPLDLQKIKEDLQLDNIIFRDGHPFLNSNFYAPNLLEICNNQNQIQLKFINDKENLPYILSQIVSRKKVYQFYIDNKYILDNSEHLYNINIESIRDINNFIL